MDTNILIAICFVCVTTVVVAFMYFSYKGWRKGTELGCKTAEETGKTIRTGIEAALETAKPLAEGSGNIFNAISNRINLKNKEMTELRTKYNNILNEIECLKKRRIEVNSVTSILELALIKMDVSHTGVLWKEFERVEGTAVPLTGYKLTRDEVKEYGGICRMKCQMKLGLDLTKLRFFVDHTQKSIHVSGLKTVEVIGVTPEQAEFLYSEVRRKLLKDNQIEECSVLLKHDKSIFERELNGQVLEVLKHPDTSTQSIENQIEKMGLKFLELIFITAGYKVVPAQGDSPGHLNLQLVVDDINQAITREIGSCESELLLADKNVEQCKTSLSNDIRDEINGKVIEVGKILQAQLSGLDLLVKK